MEYLRQLNFISMVLRILLAVLVGGLLGLERERRSSPAGFRTYMLVAIGSSMTVMLSQYLVIMLATQWHDAAAAVGATHDVSRFGAQVINGVGFLGAGSIILTGRQRVKGLTTAAGLWASACLGLAIGAGYYECVLVSVALILVCMYIFPALENKLILRSRYMNILAELEGLENLGAVLGKLREQDVKLFDLDLTKQPEDRRASLAVCLTAYLPKGINHAELLARLSVLDGIVSIEESQ
jgi:putative Mg2+ transporter-C (MgtC) family protein